MYHASEISRILILTTLLFLATSCAVVKISPPGPEVQTLLILPIKATNYSSHKGYGFNFRYDINNAEDNKIVHKALFRLPNREGFLIVNSLPPGSYYVSSLVVVPVTPGATAYNNRAARHDNFGLESGKITIFQNLLNIAVENDPVDPGHFPYYINISHLTSYQEELILKTLSQQQDFETWKVLGLEEEPQSGASTFANVQGVRKEITFGDRSVDEKWTDELG